MAADLVFRRAVVTGGAGFVGSHFCDLLTRHGIAVVCVDNFATGARGNITHLLGTDNFELLDRDVTEPLSIPGDVDLVVHLASPASPQHYLRMPVETLRAGSVGTLNTLDLARRKGARFVFASTSEVYGDPLVHPQTEAYWGNVNPIGPRSVYDEAKRFGEAATAAFRREHLVDTAIVRIFNTFGPRMRFDDGRVVPTFIHQALSGEPITVAGDGTQSRSLCFVEDTVRGLLAIAEAGNSGPINIGAAVESTILQLAHLLREMCDSTSPIVFVDRPVDDPGRRRPDISLALQECGWRPEIDIYKGLRATVDWCSAQRTVCCADK